MDWDGEDRREQHGWRINKEIGAGDLVAISVAVAAVLTSYFSLDKRLAVIETTGAQNAANITSTVSEIKTEIRRMSDKLDRYVERRP
jgi:hypothetical protein